ncbi:MAG: TRAFs-binding domain-containing protein [Zavarzinia sp.]|nr:TRAFs-binding domain-containing protein [Zavarzinia sp.]
MPDRGPVLPQTVEDILVEVRAARKRGELFEAFDRARGAIEDGGPDARLAYEAVLCLARAGASELAHRRYFEYGLDPDLGLDYATLLGRIEKDEALALSGPARAAKLLEAAGTYRAAYVRYPDYYPAINAATLYLLAGDEVNAREFAQIARRHLQGILEGEARPASFWDLATAAEAALILGEGEAARDAVREAMAVSDLDVTGVASTRRQLRLIIAERNLDPTILDPMTPPTVAHYTGHRLTPWGRPGRFPAALEDAVAEGIRAAIARHDIRFGYGSLASGADILFAEAILAAGGEVHAVLPFAYEDFVRISVADSGPDWVARFERLIHHPRMRISLATFDPFLGDDEIFGYAARYAMGLAVIRADMIGGPAVQLAVWDGVGGAGLAGTAADVAFWRTDMKRDGEVIWPEGTPSMVPVTPGIAAVPAQAAPGDAAQAPHRVLRALLFCDVKGFSKLNDVTIPVFFREVMGALARATRRHRDSILFKNTWGDAIHTIMRDAPSAAALALDLQDEMERIDLATLGLPEGLALRVGGHVGPIYSSWDNVLEEETFYGAQVTRCARIEPIAFTGKVFVSEAFAAELALTSPDFSSEYVGTIPTAKQFGRMPMYLLRKRG